MKRFNHILSAAIVALSFTMAGNTVRAMPICTQADSDSDGDGYGWENNTSCVVPGSHAQTAAQQYAIQPAPATPDYPVCQFADSDTDSDGYGWENNRSCTVTSASNTTATNSSNSVIAADPLTFAVCQSTASDSNGDGYGWENNRSCTVTSASNTTNPISTSNANSVIALGPLSFSACQSTASDSDGDGYGWENNDTCVITANSGTSDLDNGNDHGNVILSDGGDYSSNNNGGNVIRTASLGTGGNALEICTGKSDDLYAWTTVGDYILHTNAWAAWASSEYDWSQCIYTDKNGAKAGVSYDWGAGGGPRDYQVRSYPELIYGVKDEYRKQPKSVTGLPEAINSLPGITIDYSMNWPEYGPARAVSTSANNRYPNGTIIQGERNVSVESFFYSPDENGHCSEDIVSRNGGSNHTYEVMVWLNAGAERLPAGPNDYVTDVTLDGSTYKVYTKNNDRKYIAFVAQNPQQTGSLNWNTFIDWSTANAHRVQSLFGASTNSVQMQDNWCLGNIIVGTEIFWGAGNLDFLDWTITQRH